MNKCILCKVKEGDYHKKDCMDYKKKEIFIKKEFPCARCGKLNTFVGETVDLNMDDGRYAGLSYCNEEEMRIVRRSTFSEREFLCKRCYNYILRLRRKVAGLGKKTKKELKEEAWKKYNDLKRRYKEANLKEDGIKRKYFEKALKEKCFKKAKK